MSSVTMMPEGRTVCEQTPDEWPYRKGPGNPMSLVFRSFDLNFMAICYGRCRWGNVGITSSPQLGSAHWHFLYGLSFHCDWRYINISCWWWWPLDFRGRFYRVMTLIQRKWRADMRWTARQRHWAYGNISLLVSSLSSIWSKWSSGCRPSSSRDNAKY